MTSAAGTASSVEWVWPTGGRFDEGGPVAWQAMDLREYSTAGAQVRHPGSAARARFVQLLPLTRAPTAAVDTDRGARRGFGRRLAGAQLADGLAGRVAITCYDRYYTRELLDHLAALPASGVTYTDTPPHDPVDVVLALDVVEHVEDDGAFVHELADRLRPDGLRPGDRASSPVPLRAP